MSIRSHRDFLRIWAGQAVSNVGDGVHRIAVLWWARQATGSNTVVVMVALATTLPMILAAPVAGWLVDRVSRRWLMILSDAARVATSAVLALLAVGDALSTPVVLVCSVLAATASAVFTPAYMASITMLVPADDRAVANSMVGVNEALAGILGPALGGLLIGVWGTSSALWFDACTFVVSLLLVVASRVPMPTRERSNDPDQDKESVFAGLHLLRRDRNLRDLATVAVALNMFVAPVPILIVAFAAGPLGLGGTGYGLLEACIPAGLLVGFIVGPRLSRFRPAALVAVLATSVGIALAGLTTIALVGGLTFLAAGVGVGVANTILPTRFQNDVDPSVQGRVFALLGALMQVGRPVGLVLAAPLIAGLGPRGGLAVCGACMLAVTWFGRRGMLGPEPATGGLATGDATVPEIEVSRA
jgi:predicted MFS family arabinose efflux permease